MSAKCKSMRLSTAAVMAAALGGLGAAAIAAPTTNPPNVKVVESRGESITLYGHARAGTEPESVQLSQRVSYADLDLTTTRGARELTNRIDDAASNACDRAGKFYPPSSFQTEWQEMNVCVRNAVSAAMQQAKAAIAAAERERFGH